MIVRPATLLVVATALLLAACATPGRIEPAATLRDVATLDAGREIEQAANLQTQWPAERWWQLFADPQLDAVIDHALAHNPSLVEAGARVARARAEAESARAAAEWGGGVNATFTRTRFTENYLYPPPLGGSLQWDNQALAEIGRSLDLWNRDENAIAAALSLQQAQAVQQRAAELALATAVTRAYIGLALQYELQDAYRDVLADTERVLDITVRQLRAGIGTELAVEQARGEIPDVESQLHEVALTIALQRHQLAALIGEGPGAGDAIARPQLGDAADAAVPAELPAELLGHRPDVLARRLVVEASARGIDVARAAFYPNVNLRAFAGVLSFGFDRFMTGDSIQYGAAPAISLPLFQRGSLRAQLSSATAAYDAAVAAYNSQLLEALHEVANAVSALDELKKQQATRAEALATARRVERLATESYRAGLSDALNVVDAHRRVRLARAQQIELRFRRLDAAAQLAQALGGGFGRADIDRSRPGESR